MLASILCPDVEEHIFSYITAISDIARLLLVNREFNAKVPQYIRRITNRRYPCLMPFDFFLLFSRCQHCDIPVRIPLSLNAVSLIANQHYLRSVQIAIALTPTIDASICLLLERFLYLNAECDVTITTTDLHSQHYIQVTHCPWEIERDAGSKRAPGWSVHIVDDEDYDLPVYRNALQLIDKYRPIAWLIAEGICDNLLADLNLPSCQRLTVNDITEDYEYEHLIRFANRCPRLSIVDSHISNPLHHYEADDDSAFDLDDDLPTIHRLFIWNVPIKISRLPVVIRYFPQLVDIALVVNAEECLLHTSLINRHIIGCYLDLTLYIATDLALDIAYIQSLYPKARLVPARAPAS